MSPSLPVFRTAVLTGVAPRLRRDERRRGGAIANHSFCPPLKIQEISREKLNVPSRSRVAIPMSQWRLEDEYRYGTVLVVMAMTWCQQIIGGLFTFGDW